mgnify:FL=1|tara:strand:+ start:13949 stop:14677 length:729 start_codon:yes stop_codon:yes gene_type:complete
MILSKKKNIIVFGSSGLIGSTLKKNLKYDFNIINLDKIKQNVSDINIDASKFTQSQKKIDKLIKQYKKIDAVIICIYPKTNKKKNSKTLKAHYKDFSLEFNTHLEPYYNLNKIFVDYFKRHGGGSIINFASIYGSSLPKFEIYKNTQMIMPMYYALAKSSIIMMTKFLAKEFLKSKVRINSISPGGIFDYQNKTFLKRYSNFCAYKKLLDSSDLVGLVEFLISDTSKKITGQDFVIDDGFTL